MSEFLHRFTTPYHCSADGNVNVSCDGVAWTNEGIQGTVAATCFAYVGSGTSGDQGVSRDVVDCWEYRMYTSNLIILVQIVTRWARSRHYPSSREI